MRICVYQYYLHQCNAIHIRLLTGSHRIFHSKLLYKDYHHDHHTILHVHDAYDGYYIEACETFVAASLAYIPPFIVPRVHVIAVISYVVFVALFVFNINHCGREIKFSLKVPGFTHPLVLYDTLYHDDHHKYRNGNYAELLHPLDIIFGTQLVLKHRRPLPAQRLWKKAKEIQIALKVINAMKSSCVTK